MKKNSFLLLGLALGFSFALLSMKFFPNQTQETSNAEKKMEALKLGVFSISLTVKDLKISKEFYEKLGFKATGGDEKMNYLIMKNGKTLIGLFQGMFDNNILTFNPGWDENKKELKKFDDVRQIQTRLKEKGIVLSMEADAKTTGAAFIMLNDPDGNAILIDQHR